MNIEGTIQPTQASLQNGRAFGEEHNAARYATSAEVVPHQTYPRAHPHPQAANGNTVQAIERQMGAGEELGNYHDNAAVLETIRYQLAHGDENAGLERACLLRQFIDRHGDEKSKVLLIPGIDAMFALYWR